MKHVQIKLEEVGQAFGVVAVILDAKRRTRLHTTRTFPCGFDGPALEAARNYAQQRGWTIADETAP